MKKKILFVYDDVIKPSNNFKNIVGQLNFSEIVYKRKTFKKRLCTGLDKTSLDVQMIEILDLQALSNFKDAVREYGDYKIIHLFSYVVVNDNKIFDILLNKLLYAEQDVILLEENQPLMLSFNSLKSYKDFLDIRMTTTNLDAFSSLDLLTLRNECLIDMSNYKTFINYISGGFDARHFNQLNGDLFTVTKSSIDKLKIEKEYNFYHLLPNNMKSFFVLPYDLLIKDDIASYTMERYNFTDMAIKWVHGAITLEEFDAFLKKAFKFIESRSKKKVTVDAYKSNENALYKDKINNRIKTLKDNDNYAVIEQYIQTGTNYNSIDDIISEYFGLLDIVMKKNGKMDQLVIGHGDFCFSNILYDKETTTMKLIDPKGANLEEELWTNPYYDLAKLSHSICGLYDYFNNGLYDIKLNDQLKFELSIEGINTSKCMDMFKAYLIENGYDIQMIRVLEASLFLSMLPLHMDYPHKVFGFILNSIDIMKEVRENV